MSRNKKVAVCWTNYGPYHLARAKALQKVCNAVFLEFAGFERLYGWIPEHKNSVPLETIAKGTWEEQHVTKLSFHVWTRLSRINPDVLLVPGYANLPALTAALWGRVHGRMTVLMSDSNYQDHRRSRGKEWVKSMLARSLFQRAMVAGKRSGAYMCGLGFTATQLVWYYDVVDNEFYSSHTDVLRRTATPQQFGLPNEYVLYVGRLAAEKNIGTLLQAYDDYRAAGGTRPLVLVGQGPLEMQLRQRASRSSYSNAIHFAGFKNGTELLPYYTFAMCFVLPSLREPWGLVVNEAMASRLPVLVSNHCGCSEDLVLDGVNGFCFAPNRCEQLTKQLLDMDTRGRARRSEMGHNSVAIISKYSPERWASEVARLIAE